MDAGTCTDTDTDIDKNTDINIGTCTDTDNADILRVHDYLTTDQARE